MAVTKTINIDVDTKKAVKGLTDLKHEVSDLINETNELNETNSLFKKELAELEQQFNKIPKSALSARKAMGAEMDNLKNSIKENNLALRDFRIKKQQKQKMISDLNTVHSKVLHTTEGFAKFGSVIGGAAVGMLKMAGVSEETTDALEGTIHGVESVEHATEGATKAQKLYQTQVKGNSIATKAAALAQKAYALAVGTGSKAMKIFRLALIGTGIGALVVGVGLLIANFDKVKRAVSNAIKRFKFLKIALFPLIALVNLIKKGLEALGITESESEKRAATNAKLAESRREAEEKAHKEKLERLKAESEAEQRAFDRKIALMKALGEETAKEEQAELDRLAGGAAQARLDEQEKFNKEFADTQEQYDKQTKERAEQLAEDLLDNDKTKRGGLAELNREFKKEQELDDYFFNQKKLAAEKKYLTTSAEQVEEAENKAAIFEANTRKENISKYKQYAAERLSISRKIQDLENSILDEGIDKELEISRIQFERLIADVKGTAKEKKRLTDLYLFQQQEAEDEIRNKFRQESLEKESQFFEDNKLPLMKVQADKEVEVEYNKYAEFGKIQKLAFEKEKKERKIKNEFALQSTVDGLNVISNVAELFAGKSEKAAKRAFQVQKAVSIAQASIDTYKSANAIFASTAANPITILNPSAPFIAAGIAVAAGLANVATIGSQQFQGGGGDGGGGQESAPDLSSGAPSFNVVGDSGINQLASLQQQPVQAYVVSGEVTTSQALDRNRVENATL